MLNVFLFFVGMLVSYYVTARLMDASYSNDIAFSWLVISCATPFLAYIVWKMNEDGIIPKIIRIGVTVICIISAVLFSNDSIPAVVLNFMIVGILIYHLWVREKIKKNKRKKTSA